MIELRNFLVSKGFLYPNECGFMSNKEVEDLKTLIKSLDIRLANSEISEHEYKEVKEKYELRLQQEIELLKENSFLTDLSYVSVSGSAKITPSYISVSGSGRVEGWKGGTIKISGSGKISDDEIKVSGSASLPGDLVTQSLIASGSMVAAGSVTCVKFISSGSAKVEGNVQAEEKVAISGSGQIDGNLTGSKINISGSYKSGGSIICKELEIDGSYQIDGNVDCEELFTSELSSKSSIGGDLLCGGDVHIEQSNRGGKLKVTTIQAKGSVYLEGVTAKLVQGKSVRLGPNCQIGNIEENI